MNRDARKDRLGETRHESGRAQARPTEADRRPRRSSRLFGRRPRAAWRRGAPRARAARAVHSGPCSGCAKLRSLFSVPLRVYLAGIGSGLSPFPRGPSPLPRVSLSRSHPPTLLPFCLLPLAHPALLSLFPPSLAESLFPSSPFTLLPSSRRIVTIPICFVSAGHLILTEFTAT